MPGPATCVGASHFTSGSKPMSWSAHARLSARQLRLPPCAIDGPDGLLSGVEFSVTSMYRAADASAESCDPGRSVSRPTV